MSSWVQTIHKGDIVLDSETGLYEVIEEIQWEHNRYQFKWCSNWRYGTDKIEKVDPFEFVKQSNKIHQENEQLKMHTVQLEHENNLLYGRLNMIRDLTNEEIK